MSDSPTGNPERQLNPLERVQRAREIAAARAPLDGKKTWDQIGKDFGITERQARRIHEDFCKWQASQSDPLAVVEEAILLRHEAVEQLAYLSQHADNSNAQLGATRAMIEVDELKLQLMRSLGRLPKNLLRFQAEAEFMEIIRQQIVVLQKRGVDPAIVDEIRGLGKRSMPAANVTEIRAKEASG